MPKFENRSPEIEGIETPDAHLQFERPGLELQQFLMERAKKFDMSEIQWTEKYAEPFRKIFEEEKQNPKGDLYTKFKEVYDKNPDEFLEALQRKIEDEPQK